MDTNRDKLIDFINQKQSQFRRNQIIAYYAALIVRWTLFFANIIVLCLAIAVVVVEVHRYNNIPSETKTIIGDLGFTIILALFIILTFFINIFLSVYRLVMKYKDYKKAQRELSYIYFRVAQDPDYSYADFQQDYDKISNFYFAKKSVLKFKIIKKAIFEGKKWL